MTEYYEKIEVVVGDYGYDLEGQITDNEDAAVDITGTTLKLTVSEEDETPVLNGVTAEIVDGASGTWKYTILQDTFTTAKKLYEVNLEITWSAPAKVLTATGGLLYVRSKVVQ